MRTPLFGLALVLVSGCLAPASHRASYPVLPWDRRSDNESFRNQAPSPQSSAELPSRAVEEARLPNGIRILFIPRHDIPLVAVSIVVRRGAGDAPPGVAFLASRLGPAGAGNRVEQEIRRTLDQTAWHTWVSYDAIEIGSKVPVGLLSEVFPVMADIIQEPAITETAFLRERQRLVKMVSEDLGRSEDENDRMQGRLLFPPGHPYRATIFGSRPELEAIRPEEIKKFLAEQVTPDQIVVVAVGDLALGQLSALVQATLAKKSAPARSRAPAPTAPSAPTPSATITLIDRPALTQSLLTIAAIGPAVTDADFDSMALMNLLLGGMVTSRLNSRLREDLGYTYRAGSMIEARRGPAPFLAGTSVSQEKTGDSLREALAQIERMRTELVSDDEMETAKARYLGLALASCDSFDASLHELIGIAVHDFPADESSRRLSRVLAVSKEDIRLVASKYLAPDRVRVLVEGNAAAIRNQIASLGLGAVDVIASQRR
jgi:zinc protease